MAILSLAFLCIPVMAPPETYDKFGPRVDDILIKIYQGRDQEFLALQSGDIDIIDWPLDYATYTNLLSQPTKYTVYPLTMYDMYNLEMNCLKWPISDVNFRRAIAYLVDKQTFFQNQLKSFSGSLMDTPIAKEWTTWYNDFTAKYVYSRANAIQVLNSAGYQDYDSDGKREYRGSNGTTYELPAMDFYIRNDDPDRMHLGQDYIVPELLAVGLNVNPHIAPKQTCWTAVMTYPYNYYLYTGGWGPYTDPDYLYDQYHSKFGIEWYNARRDWCNNYVFFTNSSFDSWSSQLKYAATKADAITPAMKCQEILMDQVPMVPVWHSAGALASRANYGHWSGEERYWDKPWAGMVNQRFIHGMSTAGLNGYWTFLNAHAADWERGGVIRYGFMTGADVFNPIHADFYWDWEVLNKVYEFLVASNPYTGDDIPWMAKSWTIGNWAPGKTSVTFNLFNNILWHDNVPFTSADVKFTLEYMKLAFSPLFYTYVLDIDHINTPDAYTVEVCYNVQSTFALHWLGTVPMIPKHIWENIPAGNSRNGGEFETTGKLTGTGPFRFVSKTLQEIHLTDNPTYFRKLVRPDFYKTGSPIPTHDGDVDIDDFGIAVGHFGDAYSGTWPHPVDQWADVNKDMVVDLDDIMEIGVRFLKTEYYPYVNGYPNYYAP